MEMGKTIYMVFSKKSRVRFIFCYYTKAMLNEMTPKIKVVQKMQDYIAAHQTEEINLSDLANMDSLCGEPVSLWLPEKLRAGKSEYVQGEPFNY